MDFQQTIPNPLFLQLWSIDQERVLIPSDY